MMKRLLIITALLFGALVAFGQKNVSDKENEAAPKTALIEAQKDYQKAVKEKNSPLLIQSLIRQIKYQALIDADSVPPMLQNLEHYIPTVTNIVEKSILHSLLTEFYQMYFNFQRYNIDDRTPITGYIPRNMLEWTNNIYIAKIFEHALDAVKARSQLSKTSCLAYKEILTLGRNSPTLRPTMYDFLVYRSIDILNKLYPISNYYKQEPITDLQLFASVKDFVQMHIEAKKMDIYSNTLALYQSLLQSEIAAQRKDAILISDLDRLEYLNTQISNVPEKDSLYIHALGQLAQQNKKNPYKVEILYKLAQYYYSKKNADITNYQKALDICNSGIREFPEYFRIEILKRLAQQITRTSVFYSLEPNVYPGENQKVQLNYANLSELIITLHKIKEPTLEFLNRDKRAPQTEKVSTHTYRLPKQLYKQDTTLQIPIPNTGYYLLSVSYPNSPKIDSLYFSSSRLSTIARKTGKTNYNVLVCDLVSGKPIEGAKIKIYRKDNQKYSVVADYLSDKNGIASFSTSNQNYLYQVTQGDDNQGNLNNLPYQYFNTRPSLPFQISLFTDRAVYRPGQTVYFSGICWESTPEESKALAGQSYTVTLQDVNQQIIAQQKVKTNKFGSFAGRFTLPQEVMNGAFTITAGRARQIINVAEYKLAKFEITFNPLKEAYKLGDQLTISGIAKSYSGVNLENCKVTYTISNYFNWYIPENIIAVGKTQTNAKGEFQITFTPQKTSETSTFRNESITYQITATITSPNGETQEAQYTINITDQRYQLNSFIVPQINKKLPSSILVTARNTSGFFLTENITYELSSLRPLQKLGEQYDYEHLPIDKKVMEGTFTTGENKKLELDLSSLPSGAYLLKLAGTGENKGITLTKPFYIFILPKTNSRLFSLITGVQKRKRNVFPVKMSKYYWAHRQKTCMSYMKCILTKNSWNGNAWF